MPDEEPRSRSNESRPSDHPVQTYRVLDADRLGDSAPSEDAGLTGAVQAILRRRKTFILVFLCVCLPPIAWTLSAKPVFEASLKFFVQSHRFANSDRAEGIRTDLLLAQLASELEVIRSRDVLEKTADALGWIDSAPGATEAERRAYAIWKVAKNLKVEQGGKGASVLLLTFRHSDPEIAAQVLNTLGDFYVEKHTELNNSEEIVEFFDAQVDHFSNELRQAESALAEFTAEHRISLLSLQKDINLRRISTLDSELERVQADRISAEARIELLRGHLSPLMELPEYTTTKSEIVGLQARQNELRQQLQQARGRQRHLESISIEHERLERGLVQARTNLDLYQNRKEQARIESALDKQKILSITILQEARPPVLPLSRHLPVMIAVSLIAGLSTGAGIALLADRLDPPVGSVRAIQVVTGLPTLTIGHDSPMELISGPPLPEDEDFLGGRSALG